MTEVSNVTALQRDFEAAGLDPTGIELAWLVDIKNETEVKIRSNRSVEGFTAADPAFNPPERRADPATVEQRR